jgi:putative addiction module component (TIGR02574 family)
MKLANNKVCRNMGHTEVDMVLSRALRMSEHERAAITERLIASLDDSPEAGVEQACQEEVCQRISELDSGVATCVPWEEVRHRLREKSG